MISAEIVTDDRFLDLPHNSQLYYLQLNLRADDDGFFGGKKSLLRQLGMEETDFTPLVQAGYVHEFTSGIVVVMHWRLHNQIKKDRYTSTIHMEEMAQLEFIPNKGYVLKSENTKESNTAEAPQNMEKPLETAALPLKTGDAYTPAKAETEEWKRLYPAVDVPQQLRNMRGWLLANPKKQKTADGIGRFINAWLLNAQNTAARPGWGEPVEKTPPREPPHRVTTDTAGPASYDLEAAIRKMNTTVPKLTKKHS